MKVENMKPAAGWHMDLCRHRQVNN